MAQYKGVSKDESRALRYWKFLIYPDSCGGGWDTDVDLEGLYDRLEDTGVQLCVSPVHNRDLDEDGLFKKSHVHCMAYFPGKKGYNTVLDIFRPFGVAILKAVEDHEREEKYWCHLNCRNKTAKPEYPVEDMVCLNGYVPTGLCDLQTQSDMSRLYRLIEDNGILYFCDLANEVLANYPDLITSLNRFSAFFDRYLYSRERIVNMVKNANKVKGDNSENTLTSLMSSYKNYRIKFGGSS